DDRSSNLMLSGKIAQCPVHQVGKPPALGGEAHVRQTVETGKNRIVPCARHSPESSHHIVFPTCPVLSDFHDFGKTNRQTGVVRVSANLPVSSANCIHPTKSVRSDNLFPTV